MRNWDESEIEYLVNNYKNATYQEMEEHLNRSEKSIKVKASRLGLKKRFL